MLKGKKDIYKSIKIQHAFFDERTNGRKNSKKRVYN